MKRIFALLAALVLTIGAFGQSPKAIIAKMESVLEKHEKEGIVMTVDVKVPIVGTMTTKSWILGDKMRMEATLAGVKVITWTDGKTEWTYNTKTNKVEIKKMEGGSSSDSGGDTELFIGITDGYDVTLSKETDKVWYFTCTKMKTNKDKYDPKKIELAVAKGNYYPVKLSTKMSGITMTMRGISFGVSEKQVTFNKSDYPTATIEDKR
jgi:outer membrane lipoprotein-sorting protein